jgi:hypothetical protein
MTMCPRNIEIASPRERTSMSTQGSRWRACVIAALVVFAGVYAVSLRSSRASEPRFESDNAAVLHARLERSEGERRRLEEALQICELDTNRRSARDSVAIPPVRGTTAVSTEPHAPSSAASSPSLDPEYLRGMLRQRYGALLRDLALSPEQSEALLATLGALDPTGGLLPSAPPDPAREQGAIAQVIGPDKAAEFQRLKLTLPARAEVRAVRDRLEAAGDDLSHEQFEELTAVLSARARVIAAPAPAASTDEAPEQRFARFKSWLDEREGAFREAERDVLTPAQLQVLNAGRVPLRSSSSAAAGGQAGSAG